MKESAKTNYDEGKGKATESSWPWSWFGIAKKTVDDEKKQK